MYRFMKILLLITISALAVAMLFGCGDDGSQADNGVHTIVEIEDLLANPRRFQNETLATGTVTTFSTEGGVTLIGIVDNEHILMCRNLDCEGSKIYLLNLSGQTNPDPGDVITMLGAFEDTGGFWIFHMTDFQVSDNIIELLR